MNKNLTLQKAKELAASQIVDLQLIDSLPDSTYDKKIYKNSYIFINNTGFKTGYLCSTEYVAVNKTTGKVSSFSGNDEG